MPSYHSVYENFNQLEDHAEKFEAVAAELIRHAIQKSDGKGVSMSM